MGVATGCTGVAAGSDTGGAVGVSVGRSTMGGSTEGVSTGVATGGEGVSTEGVATEGASTEGVATGGASIGNCTGLSEGATTSADGCAVLEYVGERVGAGGAAYPLGNLHEGGPVGCWQAL
jgi:hypothetical protein